GRIITGNRHAYGQGFCVAGRAGVSHCCTGRVVSRQSLAARLRLPDYGQHLDDPVCGMLFLSSRAVYHELSLSDSSASKSVEQSEKRVIRSRSMAKIPVRQIRATPKESDFSKNFNIRDLQTLLDGKDKIEELHRHDHFFILAIKHGAGSHAIDFTSYRLSN